MLDLSWFKLRVRDIDMPKEGDLAHYDPVKARPVSPDISQRSSRND